MELLGVHVGSDSRGASNPNNVLANVRKQELSPDLEATKGAASCSRAAQVRLERPSPVGKNSQRRYCRLSLVLKIGWFAIFETENAYA